MKRISAQSEYKYTAEDAIDWLEEHVNYAGEDLTWNDLMFIRMERAIERRQQRLGEHTAEVDWLNVMSDKNAAKQGRESNVREI